MPDTSPARLLWIAYAVASTLLILSLVEAWQCLGMKAQLETARTDEAQLRDGNVLHRLHLVALEAKDPAYDSSDVDVAWDAYQHQGIVSTRALPAPPTGHDYQLWVLDPAAQAPISAGVVAVPSASQAFTVPSLSLPKPGFALTLEPAGGSATPTLPILFAVAPIQ